MDTIILGAGYGLPLEGMPGLDAMPIAASAVDWLLARVAKAEIAGWCRQVALTTLP